MSKVGVFKDTINGQECVCRVVVVKGFDIENELQRIAPGKPSKVLDTSELPDEEFRNAWEWDDNAPNKIKINLRKAKIDKINNLKLKANIKKEEIEKKLIEYSVDNDQENYNKLKSDLLKLDEIEKKPKVKLAKTLEDLKKLDIENIDKIFEDLTEN